MGVNSNAAEIRGRTEGLGAGGGGRGGGRISYTGAVTTYVSANSFVPGTSCNGMGVGAGGLSPNLQTGSTATYTATIADASQKGTAFPGTPCLVTVAGLGCYLAWANATTYIEEGNYALSTLNYLPGCPNCSRTPPAVADGTCSSDGSLSCAGGDVNYRCVAKLTTDCQPSLLINSWSGSCASPTGASDSGLIPTCASGPCVQPYQCAPH